MELGGGEGGGGWSWAGARGVEGAVDQNRSWRSALRRVSYVGHERPSGILGGFVKELKQVFRCRAHLLTPRATLHSGQLVLASDMVVQRCFSTSTRGFKAIG